MKKALCLILTVLCVLNCFSIFAFAEGTGGAKITSITTADPVSKSITLAVCQSRQIFINVSPESAKKYICWSVEDETVASVTPNGLISGKKPGKTTLKISATDGSNKSLTYNITITARKGGNSVNATNCKVVDIKKARYDYPRLCRNILKLRQKYPYLFHYETIGKSYDNRSIFEIKIGNVNSNNKVFVQATVHAREYNNSMLVMKQVEALCENYYSGTYRGRYYSELLQNCCLYIVPMANPDGVSISIHGAGSIRNKTLRTKLVKMCKKYGKGKRSYYTQWKANARGVDLNRNWDCNWKKKLKPNYTCSEGYKGPRVFSERETKILKREVERLKPKTVVSYHSTGSIIYWDFIQSGSFQRKCSDLFKTAKSLTGYRSAGNPSSHGFKTSWLSPCFGDWVANSKKIPTLTIETGRVRCPIAAKHFPKIWKENRHILPAAAYFSLNDTTIDFSAVVAQSKGFSVSAKKAGLKDFYYQVSYSQNAKSKNAEYAEFPASSGSTEISDLKANTRYYVCIRTVKKYGSIKIYGSWSAQKSVKTKA